MLCDLKPVLALAPILHPDLQYIFNDVRNFYYNMAALGKMFSTFAGPLLNKFTQTPLRQVIFYNMKEFECGFP